MTQNKDELIKNGLWNFEYDRPTVGAISEAAQDMETPSTDVREVQRGLPSNTIDHVWTAIERGLNEFPHDKIYVLHSRVIDKATKAIRNRYAPHWICPKPNFDNAVYEYDRKHDDLRLLWVLPSMTTANYLLANAVHLDTDSKELLQFVLDFKDGTLDKLAIKLNERQAKSEWTKFWTK